jgi:hypothetical protein
MDPDFFAGKLGLYQAAAIDVAMVEELSFPFASEFESV